MKRDEFGPKFQQLLEESVEGMTPAELAKAAGSSRQRAYAWIQKSRGQLVARGRTDHGATRFAWGGGAATEGTSDGGAIEPGGTLVVRGMRWSAAGGLELTLEAPDGSDLRVVVQQPHG